jgi:hypothetical protein
MLTSSRTTLEAARNAWINATPDAMPARDNTQTRETRRQHALEARDRDLLVVHDLERKLNLAHRWQVGSPDWEAAGKLVCMRRYQRCLDALEGLVVTRMFELTKMNMSHTGGCCLRSLTQI